MNVTIQEMYETKRAAYSRGLILGIAIALVSVVASSAVLIHFLVA